MIQHWAQNNARRSSGGSSDTATITVPGGTIYQYVDATFTVATDVPSPTYTWSVASGGSVISGQGTASAVIRFTGTGSRTVTCDVSGGGSASDSKPVTVTAFTPNVISSPAAWYDVLDYGSLTIDGSNNVGQINDKSGNSRHLIQGSLGQKPIYVASVLNGNPVVRTDGTDDIISSSAIAFSNFYGASGNAITVVSLQARAAGTGRIAWIVGSATNGTGEGTRYDRNVTNDLAVYNGAGSTLLSDAPDLSNGVFSIEYCYWTSGDNVRLRRYISGSASSYASASTNSGTMSINQAISLGSSALRGSYDFAEFIIYPRALTSTEFRQLDDYLTGKWGSV